MWAGRGTLALSLLLGATVATAQNPDQVIDQMQPLVDDAAGINAIGGGSASQQMLAQTVTAALDGELTAVFLPVSCASGRLVLEIRDVVGGLPGSTVLVRRTVRAALLPAVGSRFRRISLGTRLPVAAGDRFALVLSNASGSCGLGVSAGTDSYPGGEGYFDARPNPPGWLPLSGPDLDLPFMLVVIPTS